MLRLSASGLACVRGMRTVFTNLNLQLSSGEALALTGPNGAGKSSLLRLVAGLLRPQAGRIALDGDTDERTVPERAHYLGHLDAFKPALTVSENLAFWIFVQVEGGEHAREEEDGVALRREEGSRHPAVRVRGLTEVRDLPLDTREVLQVGRGREKEDVDILSFHARGQPPLPLRVVEHAASLSV